MQTVQIAIQKALDLMVSKSVALYRVGISGDDLYESYLNSYEVDPVFRDPESSVHNCNHCRNFIRRYGNIVGIDAEGELITLFHFTSEVSEEYEDTFILMNLLIKKATIQDAFVETYEFLHHEATYESVNESQSHYQLGTYKNVKRYTKEEAEKFGVVKPNETKTFHHFALKIPTQFIDKSGNSRSSIEARHRDDKNVFKRAMEELPADTLQLVLDLISQGSLLDAEAHKAKVSSFLTYKKMYDELPLDKRDNWCWVTSYKLPIARFKGELIGVLCSELAEGMDLNKACENWNKRVDPANYMKATAPITERQKQEAFRAAQEGGYLDSFNRRHATIEDIKVTEILHSNTDEKISTVSIFDNVQVKKSQHSRNEFDGIPEVSIDKFMSDLLPGCTSVELYLENKHQGNFVNLTTAIDQSSKNIFKWNNLYSWTYKGNLAGVSRIKEAVKSQGGGVTGDLRFSIMWSEGNSIDNSDLDAHCYLPNMSSIFYASRNIGGGVLDIDITGPRYHKSNGKDVVENITFVNRGRMDDGDYLFLVHGFNVSNSQGFKAEIEFDGEIYSYEYTDSVKYNESIKVAKVTKDSKGNFTIKHLLPLASGSSVSRKINNLDTNQFHKVNLMCLSPNHWGENEVGNRHYFFMLENCRTDESIRTFHNENLNSEVAEQRKVLEVLALTSMVKPDGKQLAGLGFNATVRDSVVVKLSGSHKRTVRINF